MSRSQSSNVRLRKSSNTFASLNNIGQNALIAYNTLGQQLGPAFKYQTLGYLNDPTYQVKTMNINGNRVVVVKSNTNQKYLIAARHVKKKTIEKAVHALLENATRNVRAPNVSPLSRKASPASSRRASSPAPSSRRASSPAPSSRAFLPSFSKSRASPPRVTSPRASSPRRLAETLSNMFIGGPQLKHGRIMNLMNLNPGGTILVDPAGTIKNGTYTAGGLSGPIYTKLGLQGTVTPPFDEPIPRNKKRFGQVRVNPIYSGVHDENKAKYRGGNGKPPILIHAFGPARSELKNDTLFLNLLNRTIKSTAQQADHMDPRMEKVVLLPLISAGVYRGSVGGGKYYNQFDNSVKTHFKKRLKKGKLIVGSYTDEEVAMLKGRGYNLVMKLPGEG